jgi:hypothetical protein
MPQGEDLWGSAGDATRAEVREIFARTATDRPPGESERRRPLPGVLGLPRRAWRGLSPGWRRVVVVLGVLSLAGLAIAIPAAVRTGYRVADAAREADARAKAARRRELIEDQRPRSVPVGAALVNDVRRLGGLTNPAAAAIVGARMEDAITADVQSRIRAGLLEGPARDTECRPVRDRAAREANYNCFTLSDRRDFRGTGLIPAVGRSSTWTSAPGELSVGYRFSGRADLAAAQLFWCKENPPPLHPTSFVVKVPLSTRCR